MRVNIEKKRKELKASSLEFGRAVDGEAKRLTSAVLEVESHLLSQRKIVEDEKERIKKEIEEIERKAQEKLAAEKLAKEEAERAEQEAILAKQRAEQAEIDRKQKEQQEKIDAQLREISEKERKIAEDKRIEEARVQAEVDTKERIAKEEEARKVAQEEKRIREEIIEKERILSLPDNELMKEYANKLLGVVVPTMKTDKANNFMSGKVIELTDIINCIKKGIQ